MLLQVLLLTAVASNLANIIAIEALGMVPPWLTAGKIAILLAALLFYVRTDRPQLGRYAGILLAVTTFTFGAAHLQRTAAWQGLFDTASFSGHFGSMIALKFASTVPLLLLLLFIFGSASRSYLAVGDLSVKAEPIPWLGIKANSISWRRLAILSACAIAGGTLLLTLLTVTGFSRPEQLGKLPAHLPMILFLALINSVSEGFMFRNAILAPLRDLLPKGQVLLVAAGFFGLAHFYGAPSGVLGVFMSGLLGWYLCRSMYETGGLAAPWIIHFLQDVVIFSTLVVLGQLI